MRFASFICHSKYKITAQFLSHACVYILAVFLPTAARIVRCGRLENPEFGSVRLTGTTVGSKATYSCIDGYILEGLQFRFCQQDGEWSGEEPTCRRMSSFAVA